jgi:hypothetical protein
VTQPLTADLCARAIVAACGVYGKDPFAAINAARAGRTPLVAAATASRSATGASVVTVSRVFQVHQTTINKHEREGTAKFRRAVEAARGAIQIEAESTTTDLLVVNDKKPRAGTDVAPPPVALEAPAPARVDHTAAIAEALARRRERTAGIDVVVVGVEADRALIGATEPGGCVWPMGDPRSADYRSCQATPLSGRLYCAEHLKKAGMKPVAKPLASVGRVAAPYADREAG